MSWLPPVFLNLYLSVPPVVLNRTSPPQNAISVMLYGLPSVDVEAVDDHGFLDDAADGGDHGFLVALGAAAAGDGVDEAMLQDAIAIDCEMVKTESQNSALARVCAVSWDEEVLMDEYVAPGAPVSDYLTVRHKTHTHRTGFLCSGSASSPHFTRT